MKRASMRKITGISLTILLGIFTIAISYLLWFFPHSIQAAPLKQSGQPVISFDQTSFEVDEGMDIDISVSLSASTNQTVTVSYFTQGTSATGGTDYTDTSGVLTFPPNTTASQTFTVETNQDTIDEPSEIIKVNLVNPVNATLSGGGVNLTVDLRILDDDPSATATPTNTPTGNQPIFADQYEPNNAFADATSIAAGQRLCNITLWPTGDEDFFTFFAKDGFSYEIFTDDLEPGLDTVMTIYGPQGNVIATSDDFGGERRSEVEIRANQDGFYFARIINQDPSDPADKTYCFEVAEIVPTATPTFVPADEAGDSCEWNSDIEHACLIGVGETKSMNFIPTQGSDQDTDIYRLWIKVGIEYTCETLNLSTHADTNIILWDQNGNPFAPWIGNDDREDATGDAPDFSSKVSYFAGYTGWLYIVVGPVNPPAFEEAHLHTYDITCSSSAATATPTPTATFPPLPPSTGGTGGTSATNTPAVTPTTIVFPTFPATATPFVLPTATPTPTPPVVQFQPLPTATPLSGGGQDVTINVTLYYDVNDSFTPELTEGIINVAVFLFDSATGNLLQFGTTNETGAIRFTDVMASGPVRIVVPFLNYNQIIVGGNEDLLLRIAPQPLPIGIP